MATLNAPFVQHFIDRQLEALPSKAWRPLHFLNLYRLTLAGLFLTIILVDVSPSLLGRHNAALFFIVSLVYVGISVMNSFMIRWRRPPFLYQVYFQIFVDIIVLVLLMHASGGLASGLGILLIVAVAGGSLLLARRSAILLAAVATVLLLLEQTYIIIYSENLDVSYTQAGLLGAILFATAAMAQFLARRVRESESLAAQRGVDLANMEQLTEYIIQRMQTGIVVVDRKERVRFINESASYLLGSTSATHTQTLATLAPELANHLHTWQEDSGSAQQIFRPTSTAANLIPRFASLGQTRSAGTLIFLEDIAAMTQQAQQLKLASLGRLTASIAHEIRNPLGAISHAGQLLAESKQLGKSELRMTQIIAENSKRVNTIIENVLNLSRRQQSEPEEVKLSDWLNHFVDEFCQTKQLVSSTIRFSVKPDSIIVRFDPNQLYQVLWNLCQNGLRYSRPGKNEYLLSIEGGITTDAPTPFLDVIDYGPGIEPEFAETVFEPFFTTDAKGTGLGLYIARELCEANQARLNYLSHSAGGCCFRITFTDLRRAQVK